MTVPTFLGGGDGGGGGDNGVNADGRSGEWPLPLSVAAWLTTTALGTPSHALSPAYPEGGGRGGGGMSIQMGLQRQGQM